MDNKNKKQTRKKFINLGISSAALLATFRFLNFKKKQKGTDTVKMLTQDGKLVEVAIASLPSKKKKITNKEMQNWVKKNVAI
jgi:hypothetical protein